MRSLVIASEVLPLAMFSKYRPSNTKQMRKIPISKKTFGSKSASNAPMITATTEYTYAAVVPVQKEIIIKKLVKRVYKWYTNACSSVRMRITLNMRIFVLAWKRRIEGECICMHVPEWFRVSE